MARFEKLSKELQTLVHRQEELQPLIKKVQDENYPIEVLYNDLLEAKLGFFAWHLKNGDYNENETQDSSDATPPADPSGNSQEPKADAQPATPDVPASPNDTEPKEPTAPIDPTQLPRCQTCETGNYPIDAEHTFMTFDHPYEDPKLSQKTETQNGQ